MLRSSFDAFVQESPVSVMMRGVMEYVFRPQGINEIFESYAKVNTRESYCFRVWPICWVWWCVGFGSAVDLLLLPKSVIQTQILRYWWLMPQSVHRCVFPLLLPKLIHWYRLNWLQSNNHQPLVRLAGIVSVFWTKWLEFIGTHFLSWHCLHFSMMHQLGLLTGGTNKTHNGIIGKSCSPANARSPTRRNIADQVMRWLRTSISGVVPNSF